MSKFNNKFVLQKAKNSKHTLKNIFKRIEGRKELIVISIVFSFIGIGLYLFASIAFGQIIQFFFVPKIS